MEDELIVHGQPKAPLIHCLPVELLSLIFTMVAYEARQTIAPTTWMQLLLVCQLWKRIACDIAELWRVIYLNSNQNWLQLCLARAPRCLIDLHLANVSVRDLHKAKHHILPHKDRIRAMRINDSHDRLMNGITDLFTVGLPALEDLSFVPVEWRVKQETSFALTAQAFPWIRSLTLSGISIPREPAFYRNLRYLELHEHCCEGNQFTIRDFFDALHAASLCLEDLDLSRFDPIQEPRPVERPQIHLRNLRSLCMDNTFRIASQILKHLRIPPSTHLRLRIALSGGEALEHRTTERLLASLVPPHIRVILDHAEELAVLVERERFRVRVFDTAPSSSSPECRNMHSERVRVEVFGPYFPAEALRAVAVICTAPLTTLSIHSAKILHDLGDWRIVLGTFAMLENLVIHGRHEGWIGSIGVAFTALTKEVDAGLSAIVGSRGGAHCPSLRSVRVEGLSSGALLEVQESHRFLNIIVECLRSRQGYARKLETLTLRSFLRHEDCGELEDLVDKLEIAP